MGEEREVLESLLLEMRRGTLVLGVLSQLDKPQYGYALVQRMESRGVPIDPNTLYPLCGGLRSRGFWKAAGKRMALSRASITGERHTGDNFRDPAAAVAGDVCRCGESVEKGDGLRKSGCARQRKEKSQ